MLPNHSMVCVHLGSHTYYFTSGRRISDWVNGSACLWDTSRFMHAIQPKNPWQKRSVSLYSLHVSLSDVYQLTYFCSMSSGVDVQAAITYLGIAQTSRLASGASTFVIAYACHKLLLPLRLAITATATPLIVRYLQRLGWIKKADVAQDSSKDVHV